MNREAPWLVGRSDRLVWLEASLRAFGVRAPADEVYAAVWLHVEVVPASLDLVQRVRTAGCQIHLGTNQDLQRGLHMRRNLGDDALFDVSCYSYELGVPSPTSGSFARPSGGSGPPRTTSYSSTTWRRTSPAREPPASRRSGGPSPRATTLWSAGCPRTGSSSADRLGGEGGERHSPSVNGHAGRVESESVADSETAVEFTTAAEDDVDVARVVWLGMGVDDVDRLMPLT
jgi:hypothetical protein